MERTSWLWTIVLFFGASVAFRGVQQLTEDQPVGVTLAIEVVVLGAIVAGVVLVVRRNSRRDGED